MRNCTFDYFLPFQVIWQSLAYSQDTVRRADRTYWRQGYAEGPAVCFSMVMHRKGMGLKAPK